MLTEFVPSRLTKLSRIVGVDRCAMAVKGRGSQAKSTVSGFKAAAFACIVTMFVKAAYCPPTG